MSIENNNEGYIVKCLRKKHLGLGIFVWQEPEDVSLVFINDIMCILPEPTPTRRGEIAFKYDFSNKKYFIK